VVFEHTFLQDGHLLRPFSRVAEVKCRGYSWPLQRRITDFGSDNAFAKVNDKLAEHYGISIPDSSARNITEEHAHAIRRNECLKDEIPARDGVDYLIGGMDGTMIPIVEVVDKTDAGEPSDKRKTRKVGWKEGRLTLAYSKGVVDPIFGATMGNPDQTGDHLLDCAIRAGLGQQTKVHCCGDGASWIVDQVDRVFGSQAEYLIDFYHLCDYLAAASKPCVPDNPTVWLETQKQRMKENRSVEVLQELEPHIEHISVKDEQAPVRKCHRYIKNRPCQFNYKGALEADLPIGSGRVESAHRYVIQDRLKIAGAWWKEDNAQNMLALRTLRANSDWENYWDQNIKKAA
jgi:hypothetical protein